LLFTKLIAINGEVNVSYLQHQDKGYTMENVMAAVCDRLRYHNKKAKDNINSSSHIQPLPGGMFAM